MEQELIHDLVAAYALNALDDSERREFEEHLAACEQCSDELESLQDAAMALAYVPEGPAPPPALRDRLLDRVHAEQTATVVRVPARRRFALPAFATFGVAAAAAAVVLGLWASSLSSSLDRKNAALGVLANASAKHMQLGMDNQVVVAPDGRAVVVSSLSRAPSGKTYELWVIDRSGARPAGLFARGGTGAILLSRSVPKGAQVGLSLERAGGVKIHPTQIIAVSPIFT
ncbi:MAG TPA: anti-sigma factor [Gaiellaceae bacterium]|nr:anti-sigma factor [Gaiellaceae bacterium]